MANKNNKSQIHQDAVFLIKEKKKCFQSLKKNVKFIFIGRNHNTLKWVQKLIVYQPKIALFYNCGI